MSMDVYTAKRTELVSQQKTQHQIVEIVITHLLEAITSKLD